MSLSKWLGLVSWAEISVKGEGSGEIEAAGWSGAIGARWIWGASSARTTNAETPLILTEAQNSELPKSCTRGLPQDVSIALEPSGSLILKCPTLY